MNDRVGQIWKTQNYFAGGWIVYLITESKDGVHNGIVLDDNTDHQIGKSIIVFETIKGMSWEDDTLTYERIQ